MSAPDWIAMIATERGMPAGWRWRKLEVKGEHPHDVLLVTGGVPGGAFRSGPRKGKPNPRLDTDVAELAIARIDVDNRKLTWECDTGKCFACGGDGHIVTGITVGQPPRTRPCGRCGGDGRARVEHADRSKAP